MCAVKTENKPGFFNSLLHNRCTRCRKGQLFLYRNPYHLKTTMKMADTCEVCGQEFEPEVGFYYGTGFVSYGLAVMICVASLLVWIVTIGISLTDDRIFWWIGANAVLLLAIQPLLMRLSRTIWLAIFIHYDPDWKLHPPKAAERINQSQKNNW